jgi:drug/metabolite transporter (DMT)-like permease
MTKELKGWLLLLLLAGIWGSSFILMKRGMHTNEGESIFTDAQVGALRMTIAGLVLLPYSILHFRKIKSLKQLIFLAIVGFFGNFFPAFLFTYAETGISSGFTGMLNSFTPIFTVIIGFAVFKVKLSTFQIIGVAIGTIGIYLLMDAGKTISLNGSWLHIFAVVIATLCYAVSLNTIKHTLQNFSSVEITSLAFMLVLPTALLALFQFGTIDTIQNNPHAMEGLGYIAILSIFGTALAVILFNRIISVTSALFASSVTYFIPIVAVLIGYYFNEFISWTQVLAMGIILIGVFFVNFASQIWSKKEAQNNNTEEKQ